MTLPKSSTAVPNERYRRVSNATLRQWWADPNIKVREIAATIGVSRRAVQQRASDLGLGPKAMASRRRPLPMLAELWAAGVTTKRIADHYGVSATWIVQQVRAMGLPLRRQGSYRRITVAQVLHDLAQEAMRESLAASAAETRARIMADGRADKIGTRWAV